MVVKKSRFEEISSNGDKGSHESGNLSQRNYNEDLLSEIGLFECRPAEYIRM